MTASSLATKTRWTAGLSRLRSWISQHHRLNVFCHGINGRMYSSESEAAVGQDPDVYCRDFVRRHDRDSYMISQFFPKHLQPACLAVKAFYIELAMIQDTVSNPLISQMRVQFWKDAIQHLETPRHPIALALRSASRITRITPYHLRRIIDARDKELDSPSHFSLDSLLAHSEATSSTLNYLLLSILDLQDEKLSHAASHLGAAQTVSTLLRALPYHASKGFMVVPANITAKHHVSQEDVFRNGPAAEGLSDAVYEFAVVANDHLITAREMLKNARGQVEVPRAAMSVFLSAVPVQNYLTRLEAANFNAFDPKLQLRNGVQMPWRIWRSYFNNSF